MSANILRFSPSSHRRFIHHPSFFSKNKFSRAVIIGNNSVLFALRDALDHHGADLYPPVTLIYTTFWLDNLHPDHGKHNWGQTIYGLPRSARKRFIEMHPGYPEDKLLLWSEFQAVRKAVLDEVCAHPKIDSYIGQPESMSKTADAWSIRLGNDLVIPVPLNSFFYNWGRKPRMIPAVSRSIVDLYERSRDAVANPIMIIGRGLSLRWFLDHFPEHRIINYARPNTTIPNVPANVHIDEAKAITEGRLQIFTSDKYNVVTNNTGLLGNLEEISTGNKVFGFDIPVYMAAGLIPDHRFCADVPEQQKLLLPEFDADGRLISSVDPKTSQLVDDIFHGPGNVRIKGALAETYTLLMEMTGNLDWTAEPWFYRGRSHAEQLKTLAKQFDIELTLDFFDAVDHVVDALTNPPHPDEGLKIRMDVFKKLYAPSPKQVLQFENCLATMFPANNGAKIKSRV